MVRQSGLACKNRGKNTEAQLAVQDYCFKIDFIKLSNLMINYKHYFKECHF